MSKDKEHLFDDLIEALEAMSQDAAGDETGASPSTDASPKGAKAVPSPSAVSVTGNKGGQRKPAAMKNALMGFAATGYQRVGSLVDIRLVVRMSIGLVVAGALTLFFITRPYTSSRADAHMPHDPSKMIAEAHTELERVTIREIEEPEWVRQTDLPPVEPVSVNVEPRPSAAAFNSRAVRTETIRLGERSYPDATQTTPVVKPAPDQAPGASVENGPQPQADPVNIAALPSSQPEPVAAPAPVIAQAPAAKDPETVKQIEALYRRGLELEQLNDLSAARLLFKRAADRGHAEAAFALGQTYDAAMHPRAQALGAVMDEDMARHYYIRARDLGSDRARARLAVLYGVKG